MGVGPLVKLPVPVALRDPMRWPAAAGALLQPLRASRPGMLRARGQSRAAVQPCDNCTDAPDGWEYVFSYGSNSTAQLAQRLGRNGAFEFHPAMLPDHCRIFAGHSQRWGGAVASVHPCPGQQVHGLLVLMTAAEMGVLDTYEGSYTRMVKVFHYHDQAGQAKEAKGWVYVKDDTTWRGPPSQSYLLAIHKMLSEGGHSCHVDICQVARDDSVVRSGHWTLDKGLVVSEPEPAGTAV